MLTVKIVTSNEDTDFSNELLARLWKDYPAVKTETYNEDNYKEKKKAIMIKASCGTRLTPFVAIYDDKELVKALYTDIRECTVHHVVKALECY